MFLFSSFLGGQVDIPKAPALGLLLDKVSMKLIQVNRSADTDRQTDRQTDTKTGEWETDRRRGRQVDIWTDRDPA